MSKLLLAIGIMFLFPLAVTANVSDNSSPAYVITEYPSYGTLSEDGLELIYTPNPGFHGVDSFTYKVNDGELDSNIATVYITVNPVGRDYDVNSDGAVNVLDMLLVGQHWGETGEAGWIREDVNEDGNINVLDMIIIGQHWAR